MVTLYFDQWSAGWVGIHRLVNVLCLCPVQTGEYVKRESWWEGNCKIPWKTYKIWIFSLRSVRLSTGALTPIQSWEVGNIVVMCCPLVLFPVGL